MSTDVLVHCRRSLRNLEPKLQTRKNNALFFLETFLVWKNLLTSKRGHSGGLIFLILINWGQNFWGL